MLVWDQDLLGPPGLFASEPTADAALCFACLLLHRFVKLVNCLVQLLARSILIFPGLGLGFGELSARFVDLQSCLVWEIVTLKASYGLVQLPSSLCSHRFTLLFVLLLLAGGIRGDLGSSFSGIGWAQ
jgi:hypothetical protein